MPQLAGSVPNRSGNLRRYSAWRARVLWYQRRERSRVAVGDGVRLVLANIGIRPGHFFAQEQILHTRDGEYVCLSCD